MPELLTAAEMRDREQACIRAGTATGRDLMARAGQAVTDAIAARWPAGNACMRVIILCGPGNNGGDGYVVATRLKRAGHDVAVLAMGDADRLPADAAYFRGLWEKTGDVHPLEADRIEALLARGDSQAVEIVDALFGTGLTRPVSPGLARVFDVLDRRHHGPRIAVDAPSGLCLDSGRVLGHALRADLTVTFQWAKIGHYLDQGPAMSGQVQIADIGIPDPGQGDHETVRLLSDPPVALAALGKVAAGHKYSHGHALVMTGGFGRTGAARLAGRAALRCGAGLVTLGVPHEAAPETAAQITAMMMRQIDDQGALAGVLSDGRINAICLGPGLGRDRARDLLPGILTPPGDNARATVIDADALTAFDDAPEQLFGMLHPACILTPHWGEFRRLFPDIADRLDAPAATGPACSRVDAVRAAAARAGCVVLLKGADTPIADPAGRVSLHAAHYGREAPWLATAGSGDVLAGIITGLLARGFEPVGAAEMAVWLHVECARVFGPGLIAEDLPEMIPRILRRAENVGAGQV